MNKFISLNNGEIFLLDDLVSITLGSINNNKNRTLQFLYKDRAINSSLYKSDEVVNDLKYISKLLHTKCRVKKDVVPGEDFLERQARLKSQLQENQKQRDRKESGKPKDYPQGNDTNGIDEMDISDDDWKFVQEHCRDW